MPPHLGDVYACGERSAITRPRFARSGAGEISRSQHAHIQEWARTYKFGYLRGKRNRAMLSLLICCGLRRAVVGKGGHIRTVPIPLWVKKTVPP
jgi:hypothetical protein